MGKLAGTPCAAGTYSDIEGAGSCTACALGYESDEGATSCTPKICKEEGILNLAGGATSVEASYTNGTDLISFFCAPGYEVAGSITCQADGQFSSTPTCQKITCTPSEGKTRVTILLREV